MHKSFIAVVGLTLLTGCPDTEGEFCAFDQRYKDAKQMGANRDSCESTPIVVETDCEMCATMPLAAGDYPDYIFALSTAIAPAAPILFDAQMTIDAGDPTTFTLVLEPLECNPTTGCPKNPLGGVFTIGPFDLDGNYCLASELPVIDVPGEANPISGNPVQADGVFLTGSICSDGAFICGTIPVGNAIVGGNPIPINDSDWTLERLPGPGMYPDTPKLNCEEAP